MDIVIIECGFVIVTIGDTCFSLSGLVNSRVESDTQLLPVLRTAGYILSESLGSFSLEKEE